MTAEVHVLFEGYIGPATASTVSLVVEGGHVIVIDPGMVPRPEAILEPLTSRGYSPEDVTDVVLSHHHPDHTMHAGRFVNARVHDHWATYTADRWDDRPAEGFEVAPSTVLMETPGHTPQDITTLVRTHDGLVVFTHLWWSSDGPSEDPYATDPRSLHANRERVLSLGPALIVPGHGAPFEPRPGIPH